MSWTGEQLWRINAATIRRRAAVFLPHRGGPEIDDPARIDAAVVALAELGYRLDDCAREALVSAEDAWVLVQAAAALEGADVSYEPFYPNFPQQVRDASAFTLRLNALFHYLGDITGKRWVPRYDRTQRHELEDVPKATVLTALREHELRQIVVDLMTQGQPFSEEDRADLVALKDFTPRQVPQIEVRENLARLSVTFPELDFSASVKTATDVLRLAVAMSGGDVSLATRTRFRTFSRPERRRLLGLLEEHGRPEDLRRWEERWKRLTRHLRPGDHKARFPKAAEMLHALSAGTLPRSFESHLEEVLERGDVPAALNLLTHRPGIFARRLAHLIRACRENAALEEQVAATFAWVAGELSTPVLVQLWQYFASPDNTVLPDRVVAIKTGTDQRSRIIANRRSLRGVDARLVEVIEDALRARATLGPTWVNRELFRQYAVPLGNRSASPGLRTAGRGSRLRIPEGRVVRFFMHWRDLEEGPERRVDLDLSAFCVTEDFRQTQDIAYYNLKENGATHSGDITSAPQGAAEFIDLELETLRGRGWRYVVMTVHSFTGQPLSLVPQAWAGMMSRDGHSGELFDPRTVEIRLDLTSTGCNATPLVLDLETRETIWWDHNAGVTAGALRNLDVNANRTLVHLQHAVLGRVMTLDHLISLLATELVDDPARAEVVFDDPAVAGRRAIAPWQSECILQLLTG